MATLEIRYYANIIITLIIVYIMVRIFGPIISQYFIDKFVYPHKKNSDVDFDLMIERKKNALRTGSGPSLYNDSNYDEKEQKEKTSQHSKTEDLYLKEFEKSQDTYRQDLKEVIEIFDQMKWGEGKAIQSIRKSIHDQTSFNADLEDINKTLKKIIQEDLLISLLNEKLPNKKELIELASSYYFLSSCFEACEGKTEKLKLISRKNKEEELINSILIHILEMRGEKQEAFAKVLGQKSFSYSSLGLDDNELKSLFKKNVISEDRKSYISLKKIRESVIDKIKIASLLVDLPEIDHKSDIQVAYDILELNGEEPLDDVKKRYRSLAKEKHPDKLASFNFSEELTSKANLNFNKIKIAYDLIVERKE